jgi:DNA-binding MarR family transcriptional regulator
MTASGAICSNRLVDSPLVASQSRCVIPQPPLCISPTAVPVAPPFAAWLDQALSTSSLNVTDIRVLEAVAAHHARLQRGGCSRMSVKSLSLDTGSSPRTVRSSIDRLVRFGLLALQRGNGSRSAYLPALPQHRMVIATLAAGVQEPSHA